MGALHEFRTFAVVGWNILLSLVGVRSMHYALVKLKPTYEWGICCYCRACSEQSLLSLPELQLYMLVGQNDGSGSP